MSGSINGSCSLQVDWQPNAPAAEMMARDAALLARAERGEARARLYTWDQVWVTLGRSQTRETALRTECRVPSSLRPTGGKAVLHGHDLTIGLAVPLKMVGLPEGSRDLKLAYRRLIAPIVAGLMDGGLPAMLAEGSRFVRSRGKVADCFAHVSPNDVVDPQTGRKVCGCALRMTHSEILLQASVPIRPPLVDPRTVYLGAAESTWGQADEERLVTSLRSALGHGFVHLR